MALAEPSGHLAALSADLRHYDAMTDRYRTASGWSVEVVERSGTPDNSDGQQLRVRYHGFYVADVRTVAGLEQWFPLADLEPDGLMLQQHFVIAGLPSLVVAGFGRCLRRIARSG